MPSLNRFVNGSIQRLAKIKYAQGVSAKFDIMVYAMLNSFPRPIKNQFHALDATISELTSIFDGVILRINGVEYVFTDKESLRIADPEYEAWIWR